MVTMAPPWALSSAVVSLVLCVVHVGSIDELELQRLDQVRSGQEGLEIELKV